MGLVFFYAGPAPSRLHLALKLQWGRYEFFWYKPGYIHTLFGDLICSPEAFDQLGVQEDLMFDHVKF